LGAYAAYHFVSEENIMYLTRYPDLPRQEAEHGRLLGSFQEKVKGYEEGRIPLEGLIQFLVDWFVSHSTEEDRKIGLHVQQAN
jgi:hemerythrin